MPDDAAVEQEPPVNIALPWYEGGCSVVPIQANGTKRPTRDWSTLQQAPMSRKDVEWYWREGENVGVAVICGAVSGNLEMTELESVATTSDCLDRINKECALRGIDNTWNELLICGYAEWTPSGGIHLIYRIEDHDIPGNTKLASDKDGKTLAETRGEGGYVIVAPTNGRCHPSGEAWSVIAGKLGVVPTINWSQRMAIHSAITAALDESPPPPPVIPQREVVIRSSDNYRPGDEFNERMTWEEHWFTSQGWRVSHRAGNETFWVRPGKEVRDGHSATTGYRDGQQDCLFVFSTSAGLPTEQPLSKFWVYAFYYHNGDMGAAATSLRSKGFGTQNLIDPAKALEVWDPENFMTADGEVGLPVLGGTDLTDTGNGKRMKDQVGDRFRYSSKEKAWYLWNGIAWERDERQEIERAAQDIAIQTYDQACAAFTAARGTADEKLSGKRLAEAKAGLNRTRLKSAIDRFSIQEGISIRPEDFDCRPELLNFANGTLNLDTMELLNHDPADMLTLTMGAELVIGADCPKFRLFMEDAFPDPSVRDYVQRALGYSLLGRPRERTMFLLHGPSGTGKSVLTSVMTQVFGGYGTTAPATTFRIKKNETSVDVHELRGKRFVCTSEMTEGALLDEELVKRITGGDIISSRGLYEQYQHWRAQGTIWIATNFLPRVNSDDNAIWRRAKTIAMRTEFVADGRQEILGYADILVLERNGIVNWLLEGLAAYQERGLDEPSAITEDIQNYRVDTDTVASFLRDLTEEGVLAMDPEGEVPSAILVSLYESYCSQNRMQALGHRRYANRLKALGMSPGKIGGRSYWHGLRHNVNAGFTGTM